MRWPTLAAMLCVLVASAHAGAEPPRAQAARKRPEGQAPPGMVQVGPGTYRPFYPASASEAAIPMPRFWLDEVPVTQAQFLAFVKKHPEWRRDRVNRLFADGHYLVSWAGPLRLGPAVAPNGPVVGVSWFAAKAYCAERGARLPTEAQWEFAGAAGLTNPDGRGDAELTARILAWYSKPTPPQLPPVGGSPPNAWGVKDMVGLVWEWVFDFNSALVSNDARDSGDKDGARFCGLGALGASDPSDYASFMRIAMRSSLHADYTTKNLGFRCAAPFEEAKP